MSYNEENRNAKLYNIEDIMKIIESQLKSIIGDDPDYYADYDFELTNDQMFIKNTNRKKTGNIYIVVKFLPADINYNQNIVPITITAVSEYNHIEVCQRLLMEYAQTFNLIDDITENKITYNQTYTTPQIMGSFNEIYNGYRSTFLMSGTFMLSYNSNSSKLYYIDEENKEVPIDTIIFSEDVNIQLDTQPFYNTNDFTTSVGKFATRTINFTIFLVEDDFCNKILDIVNENFDSCPKGIDTDFNFKIEYNNGKFITKKYKLNHYNRSNNIGEMSIITCVFTN